MCLIKMSLMGSVADPGCLSQIPDPDFCPSRIPDSESKNNNKREGWKQISCHAFFCSHKFHKIENNFIFEMPKKKIWANFQRIIELFTPKKLSLSSQKYGFRIWDPEKTYSGWVKKAPDPGSATLLMGNCWVGGLSSFLRRSPCPAGRQARRGSTCTGWSTSRRRSSSPTLRTCSPTPSLNIGEKQCCWSVTCWHRTNGSGFGSGSRSWYFR